MAQLTRVSLEGFRSIKQTDLELSNLDVLIGINGAGKSNLCKFFTLLNFMMTGSLQVYVQEYLGGANALLHHGAKQTPFLRASLSFQTTQGTNQYDATLVHAAGDSLVFTEERAAFTRADGTGWPQERVLGSGHKETMLPEHRSSFPPANLITKFLRRCRAFQFHDTSLRSSIRQAGRIDERPLLSDAGNIASVLLRMKNRHPNNYQRLVERVRRVTKCFDDFVLEPQGPSDSYIMLRWKEAGAETVFDAHQASDGTLRFIALCTLLMQPDDDLPSFVVVDEPELGLHPLGLDQVSELLGEASERCQVMISTQSMTLVDVLRRDPIIVERRDDHSVLSRRAPFGVDEWLDEYSLGERWERRGRRC